jgi:hypothetical protein
MPICHPPLWVAFRQSGGTDELLSRISETRRANNTAVRAYVRDERI